MNSEDSVRLYLQFLADPTAVVDEAAVRKLEAAVERTKEPLERLRAVAALERVRNVDGAAYEEAFVRDAAAWAEAESIPASAFRTMGVSESVLVRAGLVEAKRRGGRRGAPTRPGRAKSSSVETIQAWIRSATGTFTLADVQEHVGGSPATLKKAIDGLIAAGELENLGPAATHIGRGRSPYVYRLLR